MILGHLGAAGTIFVWGTTFIATKILLQTFSAIELLMIRFVIGYFGLTALSLLQRRDGEKLPFNWRDELVFIGAALGGIVAYYGLETLALSYSSASNVGIIVSIAPLTTALLSFAFPNSEHPHLGLILGFICASVGTVFVITNGAGTLEFSPFGDILALLGTVGWAFYSIMLKSINHERYSVFTYTRKIFFYGILFLSPLLAVQGFHVKAHYFTLQNSALLLFLGLGAGTLCFVSWNFAIKQLGVLKANAYIYLTPVVTLAFSALILAEKITFQALLGCFFILGGLWLSQRRFQRAKQELR